MRSKEPLTVSPHFYSLTFLDKNIPSLKYQDIELKLIGQGDFQKLGFADSAGRFKIDVPTAGVYKLEAFHHNFYFEPVVVDIASDEEMAEVSGKKQYSAYLYSLHTGSKGVRLLYPLSLEPSHKIKYFDIEAPFNPIDYMKNPYFMMIGFSVVMMYMMKMVPKEEMEAY